MATLAASVLTLISLGCTALTMWRVGTDLEWAGDFVIPSGLLSHWQVWAGFAAAIQYLAWRLNRYAKSLAAPEPDTDFAESPRPDSVIANV